MKVVGDESCSKCYHLPVCRAIDRAREKLGDNSNLPEFYKTEAESCDFYDPSIDGWYREQLAKKQNIVL